MLYTKKHIVTAVGENKLRLFADDSNVFVTADNATTLQQNERSVVINFHMVQSQQTKS